MPSPHFIQPFTKPLKRQSIKPPGSKSITNRALILAALGTRTLTLEGALFSRDTRIMIDCLKRLGIRVEADEANTRIRVTGSNGQLSVRESPLHMGNAGTAARFVTAMLALHPRGLYSVDGDEAMRERPMLGLLDALESSGAASIKYQDKHGHMPFIFYSHGIPGGRVSLDARASSQMLSALLMIAPFARERMRIELNGGTVSKPFVAMTLRMMEYFGYNAFQEDGNVYTLEPHSQPYRAEMPIRPDSYHIEPDATAASYFIALPIVTGGSLEVALPANSLQGDTSFADILSSHGHTIERLSGMVVINNEAHNRLPGIDADFNAISDTFLTVAAIAPLLKGSTLIRGIGHTRHQETDRIHAMATELTRLGQEVEEGEDWLKITPKPLKPATVKTYDDHRIAMSFALLGCHDLHGDGRPWLGIENPECCGKTYPEYFDVLSQLHQKSHHS